MSDTAQGLAAVDEAALGGNLDLSIWGLITSADIVVQIVLLMLLAASVVCWAIILDKRSRYKRVRRDTEDFEEQFWSGQSLEELYDQTRGVGDTPMELMFISAMREWKRAVDGGRLRGTGAALQDRIGRIMRVTMNRELDTLERRLGFLATTGSTAPFVGLFGTVWGIMNSFTSIAQNADTSLIAVAPGIAEALFATAVGLVAAIPAVVAYNKFSGDMDRHAQRLEGFIDEFTAIISRQVDGERT